MNSFSRRKLLKTIGLASVPSAFPIHVKAQEKYPNRPITLVVPQPPGGDADVFCRMLQPKMVEVLGQPIVIENRPGAGGNIGTAVGARAQPDGYTFTFVNMGTMALNPNLYPNTGYSIEQFAPVCHAASYHLLICVHPSVPAKTLGELLELARKDPGSYAYGTAGNGSANHLAGEMLKSMAKVDLLHVPFSGGAPSVNATIAGETKVIVAAPMSVLPHVQSGRLRVLAVTGAKRAKALPDVPTVAEFVPGYDFSSWYGFVVPQKTRSDIIGRLNEALNASLLQTQNAARLIAGLTEPVNSTPAAFGKLIAQESTRWAKLIKQYQVRIE